MLSLSPGRKPGICKLRSPSTGQAEACPTKSALRNECKRKVGLYNLWLSRGKRRRDESRRCRHECPRHVEVTGHIHFRGESNSNQNQILPACEPMAVCRRSLLRDCWSTPQRRMSKGAIFPAELNPA